MRKQAYAAVMRYRRSKTRAIFCTFTMAAILGGPRCFPQAISGTEAAKSTAGSLADARTDLQKGELTRAETEARAVIAAEPGSADAMYLLGHILEVRKQTTESLAWFTRAASVRRPSGEDLRLVGLDYVLLNAYPEALHWLELSVKEDPQNAEAWYDLGRAQMMQEQSAVAQVSLSKALTLHPRLVKAENNLGVVYEQQNESDKAATAYQQAIAWQKDDAHPSEQPLLNLGALLLKQAKTAEALPLLQQAAAIAPNDVRCNEQLARALEQQGDRTAAIEHLQRAVVQQPESARLHYELGQMYHRAGEAEKATRELKLSKQLYGSQSNSDR